MVRQWVQLASLLTLLGASPLFASGPTGTSTGTITDPSGAVVPKARVIVRNEVTNATRDAETNEDGDYTAAVLPPVRPVYLRASGGLFDAPHPSPHLALQP